MLVKAKETEFDTVMSIYNEVLSNAENCKYSNWERGLYPTEDTAKNALSAGTLYFYFEGGQLVGTVILDTTFPQEYAKINWQFSAPENKMLTLHTLCVRPNYAGRGCGGRLLGNIEGYARANGYQVLRFDTHNDNIPAQTMYKSNGYREAGATDFFIYGKRLLRCFEKQL